MAIAPNTPAIRITEVEASMLKSTRAAPGFERTKAQRAEQRSVMNMIRSKYGIDPEVRLTIEIDAPRRLDYLMVCERESGDPIYANPGMYKTYATPRQPIQPAVKELLEGMTRGDADGIKRMALREVPEPVAAKPRNFQPLFSFTDAREPGARMPLQAFGMDEVGSVEMDELMDLIRKEGKKLKSFKKEEEGEPIVGGLGIKKGRAYFVL